MIFLEVEVAERLPISVGHDEAGVVVFDRPWRWEAAPRHVTIVVKLGLAGGVVFWLLAVLVAGAFNLP